LEWTLLLPAPPAPPPALLLLLTLTLGTCELALASATTAAAAAAIGETGDTLDELDDACNGGGASLRGGMRSLMASKPLASSNDLIWCVGENPCKAGKGKIKRHLESPNVQSTVFRSSGYRFLASLCLQRGRRAVRIQWG
jgi:hypothetical protein